MAKTYRGAFQPPVEGMRPFTLLQRRFSAAKTLSPC